MGYWRRGIVQKLMKFVLQCPVTDTRRKDRLVNQTDCYALKYPDLECLLVQNFPPSFLVRKCPVTLLTSVSFGTALVSSPTYAGRVTTGAGEGAFFS